ncbi:MAG TPA: hypothetical protein VLA61_16055 [Ideonella sp.]|uniref:hypothetical protein n=1 Tax=Ideonella sp. TaxID=1929293 RepID=UPI002CF60231|nr:hypothetical protein [Ideonella sp.]HSI49785.1 hypothetical protein [Ideonella sp.]
MRKPRSPLPAVLLPVFALAACAAPAATPPAAPQVLTLTLNTPVTLNGDGTVVSWVAVRDSRCPTGVNCIRAGDVQADLQVTQAGQPPQPITVGWGDGQRAAAAPSQAAGRQFCFLDLSPRPSAGQDVAPSSYRLQLHVLPLQAGAADCKTGAAER